MAWNTEQHQHHKYPTPLILMLHEKRLSVKSIDAWCFLDHFLVNTEKFGTWLTKLNGKSRNTCLLLKCPPIWQ